MKYDFSDKDKKTLASLGRSEHGRELVTILNRMKDSLGSIEGIEGGDYGAQVEGRKIFIALATDLIDAVKRQTRPVSPIPEDNFD